MKRIPLIIVIVLVAALSGIAESLTDPRDGQMYKVVEIGGTKWLAENLNYKAKGSFCYEDDASYCEQYGRLYTWDVAQNVCPEGWRLPSESDWGALTVADFQRNLKVHAGGFRNSKGKYELEGLRADFWSDGEFAKDKGNYAYFSFKAQKKDNSNYSKKGAMSVRCVEGGSAADECEDFGGEGQGYYESVVERKDFSVWQNIQHGMCSRGASEEFLIVFKKGFMLKCDCQQDDDFESYVTYGGGIPKFCGKSGSKCSSCQLDSFKDLKQCLPMLNATLKNGFLTE